MRRFFSVISLLFVSAASPSLHAQTAPTAPASADGLCGRGEQLRAVAEYERAAEFLAQCAKLYPADARAKPALSDAIILRLGLQQDAEAVKLASEYVKLYGQTDRPMSATIAIAIALHYIENEEWAKARDILTQSHSLLESAPIDLRIQAHLAMARGMLHGPAPEQAYVELTAARQMFGDGGAVEAQIDKAYPGEGDGQHMRRLAKTLTAAGDAMVLLADRDRIARLATLRPPVFAGPKTLVAINQHLSTKATEWMLKRRTAIEEIERQYVAVLDLRPMPPPKAVIASAAAVGKMWADYADDLSRMVPLEAYPTRRTTQTPPTMPTRAEAKAALDQLRNPILQRLAIPALKKCVDLSAKYQYTDDQSRSCDQWLVKNDPSVREISDLAPTPRPPRPEWQRDEPKRPR